MKKLISIMAMAMVLLWSCQEKDELETAAPGKVELSGSVEDGMIVVGPEGGEVQVNVTSSEDWRVSGISDWVTVSSESGKSGQTLTFTILPYEGDKARTVTYKVFSADAVQAVAITQNPLYTISLMSEDTVNVSSDANLLSVNLASNIEEFEIDYGGAEDWIKLNNVSDVFGKKIVQFDVVRSSEFKGRGTVLTLGGAGTDDVVTVTVNQAQRDTAFVEGEQRIVKGLEAISLDLVLKSNVDVTYSLPSWLVQTAGEVSEKDETGLMSQPISMTADACAGSRVASIEFRSGGATVGTLMIKQQNPNPTFVEIPDDNLRYYLVNQGWVIPEDGAKCEIVEAGLTGTSLVIGSDDPYSWSTDPIESITGVEGFPNLESLVVGNVLIKKIDVSGFPKLNSLRLVNLSDLSEVNTGSTAVANLTHVTGEYSYINVKEVVLKGDNITSIDYSADGYYLYYYETQFESIDVTGCPKLANLNVNRAAYGSYPTSLSYVYMTAAQIESVSVIKQSNVELVVR